MAKSAKESFVAELKKIEKILDRDTSPQVAQDDILTALNDESSELSKASKPKMGKILERTIRIKFSKVFAYAGKAQSDSAEQWNKRKKAFKHEVNFQTLMANDPLNNPDFGQEAEELLEKHSQAIHLVSFSEQMILGVLLVKNDVKRFAVLLQEKQPNLSRRLLDIGEAEPTLLEYLLRLNPTKEISKLLLGLAKNEGIPLEEPLHNTKDTSYRSLFRKYLDSDQFPMFIKENGKSKFYVYPLGNPEAAEPLEYDEKIEEQLAMKIESSAPCNSELINGGTRLQVQLTCSNKIVTIRVNHRNEGFGQPLQLMWLTQPPPGKEVAYFIANRITRQEMPIPKQNGEVLTHDLQAKVELVTIKQSTGSAIIVKPQKFKAFQGENMQEIGYLFWRPLYKESNEGDGNAYEDEGDETAITDDVVEEKPDEKTNGENKYPLFGWLECFIRPNIDYTVGVDKQLLVQGKNNQMYFDGQFEKTLFEKVAGILKAEGKDVLEITKSEDTLKELIVRLGKFNSEPEHSGQFRYKQTSPTTIVLEGVSERIQIEAFVNYLCAVIEREKSQKKLKVENSEQLQSMKELYRSDKNVKFSKIKEGMVEIFGSPQILQQIAKEIAEEMHEQVFSDVELFKEWARDKSQFQTRNNVLILKIDGTRYQVILSEKDPTLPPAPPIEIEIQGQTRFKAKGRPKQMLRFLRMREEYMNQEINRLRDNAKMFSQEKQLTKEQYSRIKQQFTSDPAISIIIKSELGNVRHIFKGPIERKRDVMEKVDRIIERMRQQQIQIRLNSSEECTIARVADDILNAMFARAQKEIAKVGNVDNIPSTVTLDNLSRDGATLRLKQASEQARIVFTSIMNAFTSCLKTHSDTIKSMAKLSGLLVSREAKKLRVQQKLKKAVQSDTLTSLRQQYTKLLQKGCEEFHVKFEALLHKQLKDYIDHKDLKQPFRTQLATEFENAFCNSVAKIDFFARVQENELQKLRALKPEVGHAPKIEKCIKQTVQPLFKQLTDQFSKGSLTIGSIMAAFEALSILTKTYYTLKLPIVEHLVHFNELFNKNRLIVVKTGTGSGKSTVLPPYLVGLGMRKVMVTQPRRLPCSEIYQRVASIYGVGTVGYMVAGQSENPGAKLVYITDGLLKEKLYKREEDLANIDVIMLDEIHERSKNIDLILLLLLKAMNKYTHLKVILCSATVNDEILSMFDNSIPRAVFEVKIDGFPVKEQPLDQGKPILDAVNELSGKLTMGQQMLVFFSSVAEAKQSATYFTKIHNKNACSLFGNQQNKMQRDSIQNGQIFFSTSIAETSLTFPRLKYVVDSRLSRIMLYDTDNEIMVTHEIPSSESSMKQRRGRLGRNCPGEYYYYKNSNMTAFNKHELTELDRVDLSGVLFELLMKYDTVEEARAELLKLNPKDKDLFNKRFDYAVKVLTSLNLLNDKTRVSKVCRNAVMIYGNCGDPRYNVALYEGVLAGCFENVAALVSFTMMGNYLLDTLLAEIPPSKKSPGGDLQTIGAYMLQLADKINIRTTPYEDISKALFGLRELKGKCWTGTLCRMMRQMKKFITVNPNTNASYDWRRTTACFARAFPNCAYFNKSLVGKNRKYYDKVVDEKRYWDVPTQQLAVPTQQLAVPTQPAIQYSLNHNSGCSLKENQNSIPYVIALYSLVNPFRQCVLSFCSRLEQDKIEKRIQVRVTRPEFSFKQATNMMDDKPIFDRYYDEISNAKEFDVKKAYPNFEMHGPANKVFKRVRNLYKEITNRSVVIDVSQMFRDGLQRRVDSQKDDRVRKIYEPFVRQNFDQINLFDNFKTLRYELDTSFGATLRISNKRITAQNARGQVIKLILTRLDGFFQWFIDCQKLYMQETKQKILQQPDSKILTEPVFKGICERVAEIVDSEREYHLVKNLVNGKSTTRSIRLRKMIAVCWVLVKRFDCIIKGGFVRDWVINGTETIDHSIDPQNLIKLNGRNGFYQLSEKAITTPSDIDAELSGEHLFNWELFAQEMNKLGITASHFSDDGWRFHIVFDKGSPTGGFTADLIQPYCTISHDSFDFDVNVFYIKKDHLKQVGMKIPLELELMSAQGQGQPIETKSIHVTLEDLILSCRKMQMRRTRADIHPYRIKKFKRRGWNINDNIYSPVIYKTLVTMAETCDGEAYLDKLDPNWKRKMGANFKVVKVEHLRNSSWDEAYTAAKTWIRSETGGTDANQQLLYHGTQEAGAEGIKFNGFDSRFYAKGGMYGRGAYFADTPKKSHDYTNPPNANGCRFMFVVRVALGKQEHLTEPKNDYLGPTKGYHSLLGTAGQVREYITDRWGQAKPVLLITYK